MLSVIMPTYNDAAYIRQAIEAILKQSYKNFEFIIINDASTDNTESIIKEYSHDSRVKYLKNYQNMGVVKTVNRGCLFSSGKYIFTVSSDDWINEGIFEKAITLLERNPDKGICFFDVVNFKGNHFERTFMIPEYKHPRAFSSAEMMHIHKTFNFCIPSCATIVRKKELIKRNFFAESAGYFCDVVAYTPIALETGTIYIPEVGTYFRILPKEESRHTHKTRKQLIVERSNVLTYLKNDKKLFKQLCYSTLLPRSIHYSIYTMFFRPKHWDMALPMIWVKFKLMFTKIIRKKRERKWV